MIRRRRLLQTAAAGVLAAPAYVETVGAQSAFDWKQAKGSKIEVILAKGPNNDVLQAHQKEFEELTGIRVGSEQIPEQQQRTKVAIEFASGRPSFDVVNVALHVQKKQLEKGRWLADLRPFLKDPALTAPDYDFADFGGPGVHAVTAADGSLHSIPWKQDLWIFMWNKALFADKGVAFPKTMDEMYTAAKALTDPAKGIYGFVGRGLKNANVPLFTTFQLGQDQETVSADGKTLQIDTPQAIWAGDMYKKLLRDCAPPGVVGFNWNESQTTFGQGRAAMWIDGIGFSAPLLDPTKSKIAKSVGFAVIPAGPKAQHSPTFIDALGVANGSRTKNAAWLYVQWATGKGLLREVLRTGSGTPARQSLYSDPTIQAESTFPKEWFDTALACLKIARPGLPEIVAVTEFRDTLGVALTNMIGGADVATELAQASNAFKPVLAKEAA